MQRYQRVCIWIVNTSFCHRLVKGELGSCFYSHFTGVCLCIACSKYDRHTVSFVFSSVQFGRLCFVLFHSADSDYTLCLLVISVCRSCVHYHSALLFSPTHIIAGCLHERSVRFEECMFMLLLLVAVDIVARILHATHACLPSAHIIVYVGKDMFGSSSIFFYFEKKYAFVWLVLVWSDLFNVHVLFCFFPLLFRSWVKLKNLY